MRVRKYKHGAGRRRRATAHRGGQPPPRSVLPEKAGCISAILSEKKSTARAPPLGSTLAAKLAPSEGGRKMVDEAIFADDGSGESANERATRQGLLKGRVVWFGGVGDWWKDWKFYVDNEHTLISMWRGHALHPFERFDRGCYFFCVLFFGLFMTSFIGKYHPRTVDMKDYAGWVTLSSFLIVVYDMLLRFIATSPCLQQGGSMYSACWLCRDCFRDCGRQGLYVCLAGSIGFLVGGIVLAASGKGVHPGNFFATFFATKIAAYLAEFPPLIFFFYSGRNAQREHWQEGVAGGAYPLGRAYPDPHFLENSRLEGHVTRDPWNESENPLQRSSARAVRTANRDSSKRRQKQVELLQKARDSVKSQRAAFNPVDSLGARL